MVSFPSPPPPPPKKINPFLPLFSRTRRRAHEIACNQWQFVNISQNTIFVETRVVDSLRHRLSRRRKGERERREKEEEGGRMVGGEEREEREEGVVEIGYISLVDHSCPVSSPIRDVFPAPCSKKILFSEGCQRNGGNNGGFQMKN